MALLPILREKILQSGPLSIADYMELCLAHPEHGYYRKQDPFGLRGDFITAPEISQIFGEMIGVWAYEMWRRLGAGAMSLVELGPGRGTLMADLLRATRNMPGFHDAITIHMVETSPTLANAQYIKLRNEHPRIEWLDGFEEVPEAPLLVVANEFFDALPIRQYVMTDGGMCERRVGWNEETQALEFVLGNPSLSLAKSGQKIADGTVMEQCPAARSVMRQLAARLHAHGGAALVIDYGYLGDAHRDTLQAVKAHHYHPVLADPGDADLTAHVDFNTLANVAEGEGVALFGPIAQGKFLRQIGAELRLEMLLKHAVGEQKNELIGGLERLMSPQAMGDLFQVMGLSFPAPEEMPGFA